ncbi:MAG: hypothetical protein ABI467_02260, partial [Kofleriaceae bacterium]
MLLILCACGDEGARRIADAGGPGGGPAISAFTATPAQLPAGGGATHLDWTVAGSTATLGIDQGVGDVTGMTSIDVAVTSTTTFTL